LLERKGRRPELCCLATQALMQWWILLWQREHRKQNLLPDCKYSQIRQVLMVRGLQVDPFGLRLGAYVTRGNKKFIERSLTQENQGR
jgi:hypothetical protein